MITLTSTVAIDKGNVIGYTKGFPWDMEKINDFEHWFKVTAGKTLVFGRGTFQKMYGILGADAFADKKVVVLSREENVENTDKVFTNLEDLRNFMKDFKGDSAEDLVIVGGKTIYEALVDMADELVIREPNDEIEVNGDITLDIDFSSYKKEKLDTYKYFQVLRFTK